MELCSISCLYNEEDIKFCKRSVLFWLTENIVNRGIDMSKLSDLFTIGTHEWKVIVHYSLKSGLILGLFVGFIILINLLSY